MTLDTPPATPVAPAPPSPAQRAAEGAGERDVRGVVNLVAALDEAAQNIRDLRAALARVEGERDAALKAMVAAALPLEAMIGGGTVKMHSRPVVRRIEEGVQAVRAVLALRAPGEGRGDG